MGLLSQGTPGNIDLVFVHFKIKSFQEWVLYRNHDPASCPVTFQSGSVVPVTTRGVITLPVFVVVVQGVVGQDMVPEVTIRTFASEFGQEGEKTIDGS